MKRYLLIFQMFLFIFVLCIIVTPLQTYAEFTTFGIKAGYSRTGVSGNIHYPDAYKLEHHYRNGYSLGLFMQYNISAKLFLQPELLYSKRGCDTDYILWESIIAMPSKYHHIFEYFDFPVLLKYRLPENSSAFEPNIFLGPCLSYFLSYKIEGYNGPGEDINAFEEDHLLHRWEFSAIAGAGFDYRSFTFELRYQHAFTELREYLDAKNRTFSLMVGHKL